MQHPSLSGKYSHGADRHTNGRRNAIHECCTDSLQLQKLCILGSSSSPASCHLVIRILDSDVSERRKDVAYYATRRKWRDSSHRWMAITRYHASYLDIRNLATCCARSRFSGDMSHNTMSVVNTKPLQSQSTTRIMGCDAVAATRKAALFALDNHFVVGEV